jgi:uncharacterized membrane protein YeaQ/YmgE (transglycosylase-associated protein family)
MTLSANRLKWIIIISFLALVFLPGQMPAAILKKITIGLCGAICVIFQLMNLKNINSKSDRFQSIFLLFITIGMIVAYFWF